MTRARLTLALLAVLLAFVWMTALSGQPLVPSGNARWYRQTPAFLDDATMVEVYGDALADTCYAVVHRFSKYGPTAVSLGPVPCRRGK